MNKILVILPNEVDRQKAAEVDQEECELHLLFASEDTKDVTTNTYGPHLAQPGFLTSYVDRAVDYVKENGITAIMYCHDMASVVASVVCQRTGLPGPSLESTFCSLHKYYSRKTEKSNLWFDYIHLDDPEKTWKDVVRYPCYLKAPFLTGSMGQSRIRSEKEMERALADLSKLLAPYFKGYSEFFTKYLNLEKYPLSVENIVVVEELVESCDQYCIEGWVDDTGRYTAYNTLKVTSNPRHRERILCFAFPQFTLEVTTSEKLVKFADEMGQQFGLRNTFYDVEVWKTGDGFQLIEINSRMINVYDYFYTKMWGVSVYQAAMYLACGDIDKVKSETPPESTIIKHKDGDPITALFCVDSLNVLGEGKAKDFIDFHYARVGSVVDGSFGYFGPGLQLFVTEDSPIKVTQESIGFTLSHYFVTDYTPKQLFKRAGVIMSKLIPHIDSNLYLSNPQDLIETWLVE